MHIGGTVSPFTSDVSWPFVPAGFYVENYRAFSRRQNIDIRPLTLFFGWNSSGKSALVRFLPLIAESVRNAGPPIWLAGGIGRGATWSELVCQATQRDVLRFGIRWDEGIKGEAEWDVKGDLQGRWQEIETLRWHDAGSPNAIQATNWNSLIPAIGAADEDSKPSVHILRAGLDAISSNVQWLSGIRTRPQRFTTYGGSAPLSLPPDGENAIAHLIAAHVRDQADPVIDFARTFFDSLSEQLVLDNPIVGLWRLLVHPKSAPLTRVNICDTGEGYTQVLPVLVALARACNGGPHLVCLEQPELHLHTRAQEALTQMLIHTVQNKNKPCLLVETHSEVLLMSVQLAIAKGEIPHDYVRVYWVEAGKDGTSDVVAVDFDQAGRPDSSAMIPAFEEAVRIGNDLVRVQLEKGRP